MPVGSLIMNYVQVALVLCLGISAYGRVPCARRAYGTDDQLSFVCVCNTTYCDDLDPLQRTPAGVVTVFETNKVDSRFEESQLNFGYERPDQPSRQETITIDRSRRVQTIIGFGGSFTDATGYMISLLPGQLQDNIIRDFFSENGLEYNLNRLPIGGADFSRRAYSLDDDHPGDFNLDNFALQPEDFDYKIAYMKQAISVSPYEQKFFASPWSAPAWMKNNTELNHGGFLIGEPGGQYYKTFANYFVKFLDAYREQGLPMWGITIENEPSAGTKSDYGFNSMGFTPEIQRDFLKQDLGPILQAAGYSADQLNVMIFDDQRDHLLEWADAIYRDEEAVQYVRGIAYHWYGNNPDNLGNLEITHNIDPSKFILNTESSNAEAVNPTLGYWNNLEALGRDIITVLNNWVNGYVHWNLVLNMQGGPNWADLTADAPIISYPEEEEYYKQPSFYGLGHITKFIAPGSVRIDHDHSLNDDNLLTTVFERPDGGVVVVVINTSNDAIGFTIQEGDQRLSNIVGGHTIQTYIYYNN